MEILVKQLDNPLPEPLDIKACDEFFEALGAEEVEVQMSGKNDKLDSAVNLVNEAIMAEYKRLEEISKTDEGDPILIEGETTAGYFCQLMVDPKEVAKIALGYNYPVWHILKEDYPDAMWEDLGRKFGLATVCSVDL